MGLSNSLATKWKNTGAIPKGETLAKIADYFGVSVAYLLGTEQKEKPTAESGELTEEEMKFLEWFRSQASEKDKAILKTMRGE
jgi:transcriptional regulator with XRE-family HTH domain